MISDLNSKPSNNWLKDLSDQSWNPELLISGVAIYATLQLPSVLDSSYESYIIEYQSTGLDGGFRSTLPLLAYSVFKSALQFLSITFILHFTLRTFWVGYVGFMSSYPEGIDYENLPMSDYSQQQFRRKIPSLDAVAIRLDKICSAMFAFSSVFVLQFISIGIMYTLFAVIQGTFFGSKSPLKPYETQLLLGFGIIFTGISFLAMFLNLKRFRKDDKIGYWQYRTSRIMSSFLLFTDFWMPIWLTIASHQKNKVKQVLLSFVIAVVFIPFLIYNIFTATGLGVSLFETRNFYINSGGASGIYAKFYENMRTDGMLPRVATVQADVIKDDYVKLFIAYNKSHDVWLDSLYKPLKVSDTLPRYVQNERKSIQQLKYLSDFYQIFINNEPYKKADFMFFQIRNKEKGVIAYIPNEVFEQGKNIIKIVFKRKRRPKERQEDAEIPFWCIKNKSTETPK